MSVLVKYNKKRISNQSIEGRMPPQAVDFEEAVLGTIMLEVEAIYIIADILSPESFYNNIHAEIYSAILGLHKQNIRCDLLSVTQELKKLGKLDFVGGAYKITLLTNKESHNYEYHARIIQQKFIQRELIRISTETISLAYDEGSDCFDTMEYLEKGITEISKGVSIGKIESMDSLWAQVKTHNQILLTKKGISGVPSGYGDIDGMTGGWQAPDLIIIAARPAMGKTSLVCNFARNAAVDFKIPGVIFSLEMSARQIATRIFALESNTTITEFTRRGIVDERMAYVEKDCFRLINSPLYIDDSPGISIMELRSKARKLKREKNIKWIAIDYLQLMEGDKNGGNQQNREQIISSISRGLKKLAKELNIPVIALSQLSRETEKRGGDKRPQLSDLRESGAIEQDADIVAFIHRPEYYGITEYSGGGSAVGVAEFIISKNRNGPVGSEKLKWIDYLTKFESLETESPYSQSPAMQPSKDFTEPIRSFEQEDLPF
jgi:replicative DNA helicase